MTPPVRRLGDIAAPWQDAPDWRADEARAPRIARCPNLVPDIAGSRHEPPAPPFDFDRELRREYQIWCKENAPRQTWRGRWTSALRAGTPKQWLRIALMGAGAALAAFYVVGIWPKLDPGVPEPQPERASKSARLASASPATASVSQTGNTELDTLRRRGEELIAGGQIAAARSVLERAARAGDARSAFMLAGTYDPVRADMPSSLDAPPDLELAIMWYERAKAQGLKEAGSRLQVLMQMLP